MGLLMHNVEVKNALFSSLILMQTDSKARKKMIISEGNYLPQCQKNRKMSKIFNFLFQNPFLAYISNKTWKIKSENRDLCLLFQ